MCRLRQAHNRKRDCGIKLQMAQGLLQMQEMRQPHHGEHIRSRGEQTGVHGVLSLGVSRVEDN